MPQKTGQKTEFYSAETSWLSLNMDEHQRAKYIFWKALFWRLLVGDSRVAQWTTLMVHVQDLEVRQPSSGQPQIYLDVGALVRSDVRSRAKSQS